MSKMKFTNKVERLRALLLTKKQFDELIVNRNVIGGITEADKSLMENFKRIYHMGVKQLRTFINLLNQQGPSVDEFTILYYISQLKKSPFKKFLKPLVSGSPYWRETPDILGSLGNKNRSTVATPIADLGKSSAGVNDMSFVTLDKAPEFMVKAYNELTLATNVQYKNNVESAIKLDEKLRDASPGKSNTAHGSYLVADEGTWNAISQSSGGCSERLRGYLGTEALRLYKFNRDRNLFDSSSNSDKSSQYTIERLNEYIRDNQTKQVTFKTDLLGNTFESDETRKFELEVENDTKKIKLNPHTVRGQMGDLDKPKQQPICSKPDPVIG